MTEKEAASAENPQKSDKRRIEVLSEMAQIQRRNAEMAMNVYTWMAGKKGEEPAFPEGIREKALQTVVEVFETLEKIDAEADKLL